MIVRRVRELVLGRELGRTFSMARLGDEMRGILRKESLDPQRGRDGENAAIDESGVEVRAGAIGIGIGIGTETGGE